MERTQAPLLLNLKVYSRQRFDLLLDFSTLSADLFHKFSDLSRLLLPLDDLSHQSTGLL